MIQRIILINSFWAIRYSCWWSFKMNFSKLK